MNENNSSLVAELNAVLNHEYYFCKIFVNNPVPVDDQGQATVSYLYCRDSSPKEDIEYSIVIPVYNQSAIIVDNIASALEHMGGTSLFECIVVFDGCEDDSEQKMIAFFNEHVRKYTRLDRVIVVHQPTSIFETAADNMGFLLSRGTYIVEIQADMKVLSYGFNEILAIPCKSFPNVCAVSGRCCHSWKGSVGLGHLGASFGTPGTIPETHRYKFFVADTCNRGPLLFDRAKLAELGYLDQQNFYLDNSDHDYMARARTERGWICGYVPIDVYANLQNGSNRKPRNAENCRIMNLLKKRSNGGFLAKHNMPNIRTITMFDISSMVTYK